MQNKVLCSLLLVWVTGLTTTSAFGLDWNYPAEGVSIETTPVFTLERVAGKRESLSLVPCPEGFPVNRSAFMSARGEVCGYLTEQRDGSRRNIYIHQVGSGGAKPSLCGHFLLEAMVSCPPDAIPCRVKAPKGTRVFTCATPGADTLLNNAIFLRESDTLVEFSAEGRVTIETIAAGRFRVKLEGENDGDYSVRVTKDYFRNRNIPHYAPINRSRAPHAPTGWMAWNIYFDQATAEDNLREARVASKLLRPYGLEYWSVESWQGNSDVLPVAAFHNLDLSCNKGQFPRGMKAVADEIRSLGFKPGLWIVPWGTGDRSFYEAHRDWFVHEPNGQPMSAWPGRYILDVTNDEAYEHVRKMIRTYVEDWGYEFFKIDGMGAGFGWPSLKMMRPEIRKSLAQPGMKDPIYRWTHMFREAMGEKSYFLACGAAATAPGIEDCDATRIGGDIVHPNKPVLWENVLNQAGMSLRRYYHHNIVAWNDPDTLMVDPKALSLEEARVTTTVVGLPGQVMFAGDKIAELPPERVALVRTDLPVAQTCPTELSPVNDLRPIWNLLVKTPYQSWNVVALFNWGEEDVEVGFDFAELGLDASREYAIYETWTESWQGFARNSFSMKVPRHAVRLLTVHPRSDKPILLASDRHITRGFEDVVDFKYVEGTVKMQVKCVAGHRTTVRVLHPDGRIESFVVESPRSEIVEVTGECK
ncbi:MAG: alpha-galactosidase [bacterium]|nr:alpha-galactosidase [bacterium]